MRTRSVILAALESCELSDTIALIRANLTCKDTANHHRRLHLSLQPPKRKKTMKENKTMATAHPTRLPMLQRSPAATLTMTLYTASPAGTNGRSRPTSTRAVRRKHTQIATPMVTKSCKLRMTEPSQMVLTLAGIVLRLRLSLLLPRPTTAKTMPMARRIILIARLLVARPPQSRSLQAVRSMIAIFVRLTKAF